MIKFLAASVLISTALSASGMEPEESLNENHDRRQIYTSDLHILPAITEPIQQTAFREITIYLDKDIKGKMALNKPWIYKPEMEVRLIKEPNPDMNGQLSADEIILTPQMEWDGSRCRFRLPDILTPGKWFLTVPAGYFEVRPEVREVADMPFSANELENLSVTGAWHKKGKEWSGQAMFTIHDDDGVDGKIPSCGSVNYSDRNGYFSILYPLLESLDLRGCISMEGWRAGFTADPPALNDNGRISLRLQEEKFWEVQCHSMEVLGENANNWYVSDIDSPEARKILKEAVIQNTLAKTTSVYDAFTGKQYFPTSDRRGWTEAEKKDIKPYAYDYTTRLAVLYNPEHDVDYHWGEWFRVADSLGFVSRAWVQHNAITSHDYARRILGHSEMGFSDMFEPYQYNVPPLRATLTRMMVEGQNAPGYIGEFSDNNRADSVQYEWFKGYIDRCIEDEGWIIMGLHAYRKCWKNSLPGALISEGGTYPDEWVEPLTGMDFINDPLDPPARLGIKSWSEWYPCPGTRLDMLWQLLKYCKERDMINVTSSEGFGIMGNRRMAGYYNGGVRIGHDNHLLIDDRAVYPHYIESATGEESYYNPLITGPILATIEVESSIPDPLPVTTSGLQTPEADKDGQPHYYDLTGQEVPETALARGVYILVQGNRTTKILR